MRMFQILSPLNKANTDANTNAVYQAEITDHALSTATTTTVVASKTTFTSTIVKKKKNQN